MSTFAGIIGAVLDSVPGSNQCRIAAWAARRLVNEEYAADMRRAKERRDKWLKMIDEWEAEPKP